ncbi:MAG: DUF58 domain-containing protein [Lacisediminihabitans sp.]
MSAEPRKRAASRIVRPTRRGLVSGGVGFVVLVCGYILHRTELLYLGWFALLLPAGAALFVLLRRVRIELTRSFSRPILIAGQSCVCEIQVRNLSPYATGEAQWQEVLPWHPVFTPLERLASIPGRITSRTTSQRTLRYEFVPPRRGRFPIGPLVVELSDPFGLAKSLVTVGESDLVTVIPDLETFTHGGLSMTADDGSASVQRLRALGGDDDVMTRNYRTGDALRRVHWRASAHRGELMVREEEQRSHAEARIVLDTTRRGYADRQGSAEPYQVRVGHTRGDQAQSERFEWTLKLAATLALHLEQRGFIVQFAETAPRQLATPDRVDEFLQSIAGISLVPRVGGLDESMRPDTTPDRSLGMIFAVIADAEPVTIDSLVEQRKQFGLAVAIIATPNLDEILTRLGSAGWLCLPALPEESVAPLWQSIAPLLESNRAAR